MLIKNVECCSGFAFYKKWYVVEVKDSFQRKVHVNGYEEYREAAEFVSNRRNFVPTSSIEIKSGVDIFKSAFEVGFNVDLSTCNHIRFCDVAEKNIDCFSAVVFLKEWYVMERLKNFHIKIHSVAYGDYKQAMEYCRGEGVIDRYSWEYKVLTAKEIFPYQIWVGSVLDFSECVHIKIL